MNGESKRKVMLILFFILIFVMADIRKIGVKKGGAKHFRKKIGGLPKMGGAERFLNFWGGLPRKGGFIFKGGLRVWRTLCLVWHFCSKVSMKKIEKIQYRALQFLYNDYESEYSVLLQKSDKCSMEVRRLRTMALEIFKSLNNLNPLFMKDLFSKRQNTNRRKNDLIIPTRNSVIFGDNSLRCLGPHIWNSLPENVKDISTFEKFKESINKWYGPNCKCSLCYYNN